MIKLKYSYRTKITFSENVYGHSFLLRCTPKANEFQEIVEENCIIFPAAEYTTGYDNFGNITRNGFIADLHNSYEFISEGTVILKTYRIREELNRIFLYPSKYTMPSPTINDLYNSVLIPENITALEKVILLSDAIHRCFVYEPGITNIQTSASEALTIGKGVCQDFAHILIALCRLAEIPVRYVTGFMQGEGFTHAWIEYYAYGEWFGFDPTHNRAIINEGYIKLAHGRDYEDCTVDKGVFKGLAQQKLEVFLKVEEIQQ
ncbi:MAG: transglutaminase-like domain-containing protein [Paludibacter sp.]